MQCPTRSRLNHLFSGEVLEARPERRGDPCPRCATHALIAWPVSVGLGDAGAHALGGRVRGGGRRRHPLGRGGGRGGPGGPRLRQRLARPLPALPAPPGRAVSAAPVALLPAVGPLVLAVGVRHVRQEVVHVVLGPGPLGRRPHPGGGVDAAVVRRLVAGALGLRRALARARRPSRRRLARLAFSPSGGGRRRSGRREDEGSSFCWLACWLTSSRSLGVGAEAVERLRKRIGALAEVARACRGEQRPRDARRRHLSWAGARGAGGDVGLCPLAQLRRLPSRRRRGGRLRRRTAKHRRLLPSNRKRWGSSRRSGARRYGKGGACSSVRL
mmetsp:Transcript_165451/g.402045  ORF Transcript_165451/g.402045 Transcript_165451/m.402045 type:complete len:328 (-) Transcript_165451:240-1223(-)